ncbi:hypothetical protein HPB51_003915 [Rhipicephalus microplus]|uniref:RAI1-like domain-containing protein n=1 Tax=Rhipicephalus microplus TaxID=6941 RepID=A0A9J6EXM1_RHIMP|nr:hypothetical protein HPB51_003915 [Rhipicephalus microplus]
MRRKFQLSATVAHEKCNDPMSEVQSRALEKASTCEERSRFANQPNVRAVEDDALTREAAKSQSECDEVLCQLYASEIAKIVRKDGTSCSPGGPSRVLEASQRDRDDDGIVRHVQEFDVSTMLDKAEGLWSEDVCMQFLNDALNFIKQHVEGDDGRFFLAIECGKLFFIDLIGAIHLLEYSWRQVEATTVRNCFKRAVFSVCVGDADDISDTIDQTSNIVDEACKTLLAEVLKRQDVTEGIFFLEFRDAHSDVQTSPDMSDEAIVASVVEVSPNNSDEDDMESDNTGNPGPTVTEAAHCVSFMRVFAEKRGPAEKLAHSVSEFEGPVIAARPPSRQMKITDFVTRS